MDEGSRPFPPYRPSRERVIFSWEYGRGRPTTDTRPSCSSSSAFRVHYQGVDCPLLQGFIAFRGGIVQQWVFAARDIVFGYARSFFPLEHLADLDLERRLSSRSRDLDGHDGTRALALEERIDRFQEERFDPGGGLRDLAWR